MNEECKTCFKLPPLLAQTPDERLEAIRESYNADRSQMTLMLAHKLRISEVGIMQALDGDTAHELDFSRWEELIRALSPWAM